MRSTGKCLLLFLFFLLCLEANGQRGIAKRDSLVNASMGGYPPVRVLLKTSLLSPFYWQIPLTGEYRLVSEMMIGRRQSLSAGASYLTRSLIFAISQRANKGSDIVNANGFRIQGSYRYYLVNRNYRPEGLFVSLHSSLARVRFNYKNYNEDYQILQHFNVNVLFGAQFLIADKVSLEFFAGPGYKYNLYQDYARTGYQVFDFDQLTDNYYRHFKMNAGINIGIVL